MSFKGAFYLAAPEITSVNFTSCRLISPYISHLIMKILSMIPDFLLIFIKHLEYDSLVIYNHCFFNKHPSVFTSVMCIICIMPMSDTNFSCSQFSLFHCGQYYSCVFLCHWQFLVVQSVVNTTQNISHFKNYVLHVVPTTPL